MAEAKPIMEQRSQNRLTGLKKRQQIEVAGRTMMTWVVIAAVALSFCLATGQYLFVKWQYNNKIIGSKYTAIDTLNANLTSAKTLKQEVDALVANQDLATVKTNPSDSNIKSILDALPTTFDPAALATSLQTAILGRSGVAIESIIVPNEGTVTGNVKAEPLPMQFTVVVTGSFDKIKNLVNDLQRTIRPMKINTIVLNGNDANLRATFEITTYFQAAKNVNIPTEVVK